MRCQHCGTELGEVTPQENRIADLLLRGLTNVEIGAELGISHRTVKQHMKQLFRKHQINYGFKRIKLAVELYYQRNPEKRLSAKA